MKNLLSIRAENRVLLLFLVCSDDTDEELGWSATVFDEEAFEGVGLQGALLKRMYEGWRITYGLYPRLGRG